MIKEKGCIPFGSIFGRFLPKDAPKPVQTPTLPTPVSIIVNERPGVTNQIIFDADDRLPEGFSSQQEYALSLAAKINDAYQRMDDSGPDWEDIQEH